MATQLNNGFFDAMKQSTDLSQAAQIRYALDGGTDDVTVTTTNTPRIVAFPGPTVQYTVDTTPRIQSASTTGSYTELVISTATTTGGSMTPHATISLTTPISPTGTDVDITQAQVSFTQNGPAVMASVSYTSNADPGTVTMEGATAGYITQHTMTSAEYTMSGSTIQGIGGGTTSTTYTQGGTTTVSGARLQVPTTSTGGGTATVATGNISPTTVQWQDGANLQVTKYEVTTT